MNYDTEILDILDPYTGFTTGITENRYDTHKNGKWHGCFNVWFINNTSRPVIYVQQRSMDKDMSGGFLDVTVGGHYSQGEKISDGLREIREELNIDLNFDELIYLGKRINMYKENNKINNEIVDVFLHETQKKITDILFDHTEVSALYEIPVQEMFKIYSDNSYSYEAFGMKVHGDGYLQCSKLISKKEFIPSLDCYPYKVAIQTERYFEGKPNLAI